jgi:hypothetical protein
MFCFNGVFADSGDYALAGITPEDFVARIAAQPEPANAAQLRARKRFLDGRDFAPIEGVDPKKLAESGWAVVFPFDVDPEGALVEALRPLMDHRRKQAASIKEQRYKAILGKKLGYRPGESKEDFLERMGAGGGGAVDPDQFPYYVLLVGTPEQIPFEFQYQLDVQYAVGRLCFDQNEDYALYAQAVIAAETGVTAVPKKASFFAVATPGDPATLLSSAELVTPLASLMAADQPDWRIDTLVGEPATKSRLARLLSGDPAETPALLFTASHGLMLRPDDPEQARRQGAILCQDWPGPGKGPKPTPEDFYFAGSDIATSTRLAGLFAFHFACFSGGSPAFDDFSSEPGKPKPVAARPFVAGLPRRMAARGTLASVGHVDRAWAYSFKSEGGAAQLRVFKSALKRLMEGHPVGSAMEYFNNRYAELGSDLAQRLRAATVFGDGDPLDVAFRWQ